MTVSKKKAVPLEQQQIVNKESLVNSANSDRTLWVKEFAYFIAEARGFMPGYEHEDWNTAEQKYKDAMVL